MSPSPRARALFTSSPAAAQHEVEDCPNNNRPGYASGSYREWKFGDGNTSKISLLFKSGWSTTGWSWYGTYAARLRVWDSDGKEYLNVYNHYRGTDWSIETTATYLYVSLRVDSYAGLQRPRFPRCSYPSQRRRVEELCN